MVTGGHVDDLTGKDCTWNVFRVCNTTYTIALATAAAMVKKFGKRWYFMVPDYSFGHALHANMLAAMKIARRRRGRRSRSSRSARPISRPS